MRVGLELEFGLGIVVLLEKAKSQSGKDLTVTLH